MDDLVVVKVLHPRSDLLGPVHQSLGRDLVLALAEVVEERAVGAVLHDDAEDGRLGGDAAELDDVGVVELAQVVDVRLGHLLDLLDGNQLGLEAAHEDGALRSRAEPLEVRD